MIRSPDDACHSNVSQEVNDSKGIPTVNSCGRLLSSLHGFGSTIFVPGFDYGSNEAVCH